jgi:hypothetical protein
MGHLYAGTGNVDCVFAVNDAGLWVRQYKRRRSDLFEPIHSQLFSHESCASSGLKVIDFESAGPSHLGVVATPRDGGSEKVALWDVGPMLRNPSPNAEIFCTTLRGQFCTEADRIPFEVALGPCEACPPGSRLSAYR